MKLLEFTQKYPDEESCIAKLRELRERDVHVCPQMRAQGMVLEGRQALLRMQEVPS
jgi:hypothetical protein